jgi:hypothetical protein
MTRRSRGVLGFFLVLVSALAQGCVPGLGGWQYDALPDPWKTTPGVRDSRLFDAPPHFAPWGDGLALFLCRWSRTEAIGVSLPGDASPAELRILRRALAAWASSGIGVRFAEVSPARARLEIRFVPKPLHSGLGTGNALADCAVELEDGQARVRDGRVEAELRWASVHLIRQDRDAVGREVELDRDQLLGAALHELGHALGYSAHPVRAGGSVMSRTTEDVRRIGAAAAAGKPFSDANLMALYALPNGLWVGHVGLSEAARARLGTFDRAAREAGLSGPYSRVGDDAGRYFYRGSDGAPFALRVPDFRRDLVSGAGIDFLLNPRAEALLGGESAPGSP